MRIINGFPKLVSRGQYGIWRVTAYFSDGSIHSKDYEAFTRAEAVRSYLVEFGPIHGKIHAEFQKVLDKQTVLCYNKSRK